MYSKKINNNIIEIVGIQELITICNGKTEGGFEQQLQQDIQKHFEYTECVVISFQRNCAYSDELTSYMLNKYGPGSEWCMNSNSGNEIKYYTLWKN